MATRAGVAGECSTSHRPQRSSARSIRASETTGYWGAAAVIRRVQRVAVADHVRDQTRGPARRPRVALRREVALEDRVGRPLAELGLEHRGEREAAAGPAAPGAVVAAALAPGRAQAPTPSTRTVTAAELHPEQPLDGAADGVADLRGERDEPLARAGDEPDA